ncbi:ewing's tumor-associated antigen 1 [Spea bombifrons]|uniref:ewing's tumor-associated antigen 1 n=1 Tax=Spea bombifrons TaxID=233779 RepID=UPI00234AA13B|nr:ewing's tumor-associated antigen 1 [Spea bombifrons]
MSRKKLPSEKVREENEEAGRRRSCREAGGSDRETPTKATKKHSRSRKPGGTQLPTSNASLLPKSEREEVELCLKKTPKRLSKNKLWSSTINSPSNDADQQHEIFWDPHSPTPFKLENGRRKQTSSKCAVDISDIVNRIAPKDEKPANADAGYLGMWIGDDAIPSTPVVARPRTKISRSRIIKKEDELMKLAKQFDKNMGHSEDKTAYVGGVTNNDHVPFMDNIPEEATAPKLESARQVQSSVRAQPSSQSSQRSVDQEAEAALNALFDSSTQKYSGRLSQGLSDVSANSSQDAPIKAKDNTNEKHLHAKDHSEICEKPSSSKQSTLNCQSNADILNTLVSNNNPKQDVTQKKSLEWTSVNPKVSNATDDFDDDWETDFLDDDSFVMQITQNPSLIATPKDDSPTSNFCLNDPISLAAESSNIPKAPTQCMDSSSGLNKLNNFKFVPRTSNPGVVEKPITNKPEKVCILNKAVDMNEGENVNAKPFSNAVSRVPLKSQVNSVQSVTKHNNTPAVSEHLPNTSSFKSETSKECKRTRSFTMPTSHCQQSGLPVKTFPQTIQAKHAGNINKSSAHHDEWDDPKFSDEILDMFCESDSLWETNEEEDDLLYQVCDDVEKLTQAQVEDKVDKCENMHSAGSNFKNSTNVGGRANQGQLVQKYKDGTQITAASVVNTSVVNNCNGPSLPFTTSTNKATTHIGGYRTRGNSLTASQNDLRKNSQVTLSRSTSVPVGGQCSYSRTVPSGPLSQNPVRHESAASSSKSSLAPSKYSFTRIKPSQLSVLHSNSTQVVGQNNSKDFTLQDTGANEKESNVFFHGNVKPCQQPSLKRHLSESLLQSAKVFVSEERNKKCSNEEIERKKQEALARRQMKARTFSNECART